jgi:hypothetical protein
MPHSANLDFFFDAFGVPEQERALPVQRVLGSGHLVEIRSDQGRFYLCGLPHELPIEPDDSLLESILEQPFHSGACGFVAYESSRGQLILWSEILPGPEPGAPPLPDIGAFLRELTDLSKKLSLAGAV